MVDQRALDVLFFKARSYADFDGKPVSEQTLRRLHEIMSCGPTTSNSQPMRVLYLQSKESREKLRPALSPSNQAKTMKAPVVALLAFDLKFYEALPRFYPQRPEAITWYQGPEKKTAVEVTALRNSSLQGAYFLLAARALGLDCGPMSGFDNAKVDAAFFPDGRFKSNFLCLLGYGIAAGLSPRNERYRYEEITQTL